MKETNSDDVVQSLLRDFWERPLPPLTERDGNLLVRPGKADVLIGMRRSGKTYRLFQEMDRLIQSGTDRRQLLYLNLEDDRLGAFDMAALSSAVELFYRLVPRAREHGAHFFFDEVQRVEGWTRVLRRLLDTEQVQIYATGSSSALLSTEVATEFRGRGFTTEILPFSVREVARHAGEILPERAPGARKRSRLEALVDRYLDVGGLPEVLGYDEPYRTRVLQDYVELVLVRDVVQRHGIANATAARWLALSALGSTASPLSVNKTYRDFKSRGIDVGKDTLYALLGHFEDAFLFFTVPVFRRSLRARRATPKKVYAADPGLARAVSHAAAEDLGARLETAVYLELRRRTRDPREGSISFYLTESGREVDFVVGDPDEERATTFVQVCADLHDDATREREMRALNDAMQETGVDRATLVTLREEGTARVENGAVTLVPAWRWLLGISSSEGV